MPIKQLVNLHDIVNIEIYDFTKSRHKFTNLFYKPEKTTTFCGITITSQKEGYYGDNGIDGYEYIFSVSEFNDQVNDDPEITFDENNNIVEKPKIVIETRNNGKIVIHEDSLEEINNLSRYIQKEFDSYNIPMKPLYV